MYIDSLGVQEIALSVQPKCCIQYVYNSLSFCSYPLLENSEFISDILGVE